MKVCLLFIIDDDVVVVKTMVQKINHKIISHIDFISQKKHFFYFILK